MEVKRFPYSFYPLDHVRLGAPWPVLGRLGASSVRLGGALGRLPGVLGHLGGRLGRPGSWLRFWGPRRPLARSAQGPRPPLGRLWASLDRLWDAWRPIQESCLCIAQIQESCQRVDFRGLAPCPYHQGRLWHDFVCFGINDVWKCLSELLFNSS